MRFVNSLNILGAYPSNNSFDELHPCPLCNSQNSLTVSSSNHILYFRCKNCNFNNSIFELAKLKLNLTEQGLEDALKPDGILYPALESFDEAATVLTEYRTMCTKQSALHDYMLQCNKNLTETAEGMAIMSQLFQEFGIIKKKEYLPTQIGLISKDKIPTFLSSINIKEYVNSPTLIFFNEDYNYLISGVTVYKVNSEERSHIAIIDGGSYLNNTRLNTTKVLFVAQHEILATSLYSKHAVRNSTPLPIIVTEQLTIPAQGLSSIKLINTPRFPLTLQKAFLYFDRIVQSDKVDIDVIDLPIKFSKILSQDLSNLETRGKKLVKWLCDRIIKDFNEIGSSKIYESLNSISINGYKKIHLINILHEITDNNQIVELVEDAINSNRCFVQSNVHIENINNNIVRTRPGTRTVLANFGLTISSVINGHDGISYKASIKTDRFPPVEIKFMANECSAIMIKETIRKKFIDLGYNFAVYAKEPRNNVQWIDIISGLAENRPIIKELTKLGATSRGEVNFPRFIYNCMDNSVRPQSNELCVSQPIEQMYNVQALDVDCTILLKKLLSATGCKKIGLVAGLLHVIHQIISSAFHIRNENVPFSPKHLVYADMDESFWDDVYRQLYSILSVTTYIPKLSSDMTIRTLRKFFDPYAHCGTLPLFVGVPDTLSSKFVDMLYHIEMPILFTSGDSQATFLNREVNVNYVRRTERSSSDLSVFSVEEISEIRQNFASLICKIASIVPFTNITMREASCPAQMLYDYLGDKLGVTVPHITNYAGCNYDTEAHSNLSLFFKTLHDILYVPLIRGRDYYLAQHENDDRPKYTRIGFREKDNVVLFVHRIVSWVNHRHHPTQKFDIKMLEEKLLERGLIVEDPHPDTRSHKVWHMPSHLYELLVIQLIQLDHVPHPLDMCHTVSQDSYMVSQDLVTQSDIQQELIQIGSMKFDQ